MLLRLRSANRKSERLSTAAMRGESRKCVWRWAADSTPAASRSDFPRCRFAARATRPPAAWLSCIRLSSAANCSGARVRYSRSVARCLRRKGSVATISSSDPAISAFASSFQCASPAIPGSSNTSASASALESSATSRLSGSSMARGLKAAEGCPVTAKGSST